MTDNWVGWALAAASVLALLVFVWHGLQRWSDIMRRHRDNEDRARRGEPLDASPKKAKAKKLEAMAWFAVATDDVRGAARASRTSSAADATKPVDSSRARATRSRQSARAAYTAVAGCGAGGSPALAPSARARAREKVGGE